MKLNAVGHDRVDGPSARLKPHDERFVSQRNLS
jgi:hypothetical protein